MHVDINFVPILQESTVQTVETHIYDLEGRGNTKEPAVYNLRQCDFLHRGGEGSNNVKSAIQSKQLPPCHYGKRRGERCYSDWVSGAAQIKCEGGA